MTSPILFPHRNAGRLGRSKGATTSFIIPGVDGHGQLTDTVFTANRDYYSPWAIRSPLVVDRLAAHVSSAAGTNFRIGFYAADTNWQPIGAPLADSGNLSSGTTGVKTYTPSTPIFIRPGRYLSVVNCDGAPSLFYLPGFISTFEGTLGTTSTDQSLYVARAYAAFPTPGTSWNNPTTASSAGPRHHVFYRVSAP